jgi:hypothetical protein
MEYPEQKWTLPTGYRGAPYLVKDQDRQHEMRFVPALRICLSAESHPHHAARRKRPEGRPHERRKNAGGIRDQHAALHLLRLLPGSLPGRGDFPAAGLFAHRPEPQRMIYNKEKLLSLGGEVGGIQKWKHKLEEAKAQENFPVKP